MPENRFYLNQPFEKGSHVHLQEEEFRHLKVMRPKVGEKVELVNGQNALALASLVHLAKAEAELFIEHVETKPPPKRRVILALAILKAKNLDLVIEKGTELGASAFWLFPGDRSEKKNVSIERLTRLTISALKQCGRLDLPEIVCKPPLSKWTEKPLGKAYFGDVDASKPLTPSESDTTLFIGPEKGFSQEETQILKGFAEGIHFNPNILRAETAALCGLSLILNN